jgi:hypothetical protein
MNKFLILIISILVILAGVAFLAPGDWIISPYAAQFFIVAEDIGILMILINGTFISTRYFKIALFFVMTIVLGMVMKIMHLPGATEVLASSYILVWVTYFVHFIRKKGKTLLDILKVFMLFVFVIGPPLAFLNFLSLETREYVLLINHIIFGITFLYFIKTGYSGKALFSK